MSADASYVAFARDGQVYVRDRGANTTVWASRGQNHSGGHSPSISADGTFVAFASDHPLQANDTNQASDVYEYELLSGLTARLSFDDSDGVGQGDAHSDSPSLSFDATYAAFSSQATNFVADENGVADIFFHAWGVELDSGPSSSASSAESSPQQSSADGDCSGGTSPSLVGESVTSAEESATPTGRAPGLSKRIGQGCDIARASRSRRRAPRGTGVLGHWQFEEEALTDRLRLGANLGNGNLVAQANDLKLAGTGLNLELDRFYNARTSTRAGAFGPGWTLSTGQDVRLRRLARGAVKFYGPSGEIARFSRESDGSYKTPRGIKAELTRRTDGTYELKQDQSRERYFFSAGGRLEKHQDKNDRKILLHYNAEGRVYEIEDTQNRIVALTYNANGTIDKITDRAGPDPRQHRVYDYNYRPDGRLAEYLDPDGGRYSFGYDAKGRLAAIEEPPPRRLGPRGAHRDRLRGLARQHPRDPHRPRGGHLRRAQPQL